MYFSELKDLSYINTIYIIIIIIIIIDDGAMMSCMMN